MELSNPVDISSMKSAFEGPTIISPDCKTKIFQKGNEHPQLNHLHNCIDQLSLGLYKNEYAYIFLLGRGTMLFQFVNQGGLHGFHQSKNIVYLQYYLAPY